MVQTSGNAAGCLSQPVTAICLAALRAFVQLLLPQGTSVIRAQQNHVAAPLGLFALLTPLNRQPLATAKQYCTANTHIVTVAEDYCIQLSLFGPGAAEAAHCIATLFKTDWACQFFNNWVAQNTPVPESSLTSQHASALTPQATTLQTTPIQATGGQPTLTPAHISPLYATAAQQTPFITGENQFEEHWFTELHCQLNTSFTLPQTTAPAAYLTLASLPLTLQDTPA
ncbi:MAG: hypothetical protein L0I33_08200 [Acetobacter sp.]|nr:hypothetical protein [Acetobacter sp.]